MGFDDELRDRLHASREGRQVSSPEIDDVRSRGDQRRRRARIGTAAASLVLFAGGVFGVVALTADGADEANTFVVQPENSQAQPDVTNVAATATANLTPIEWLASLDGGWVLPWDDTFIHIIYGRDFSDTTLADNLADIPEIAEFLPPEVIEIFAKDRPETLSGATQRLEEADLMDVIQKAFSEHPELSDLILVPGPGFLRAAVLGADGTWTDTEIGSLDATVDSVHGIYSDGEHLVVVSEAEHVGSTVSITTDLQNWDSHAFPGATAGSESPEVLWHPLRLSVGNEGWSGVFEQRSEAKRYVLGARYGEAPKLGAEADLTIAATDGGFFGVAYSPNGTELSFSTDGIAYSPVESPLGLTDPDITLIGSTGDKTLVFTPDKVFVGDASAENWEALSRPTSMGTLYTDQTFLGATMADSTEYPDQANATEVEQDLVRSQQLIATTDAVTWFVEDLDFSADNCCPIANGNSVLVPNKDGFNLYTLN